MRKYLLLVFILVLAGCSKPDFYDADGKGHRYMDIRSKWLVINYWATWCAPCRHEIPELNKLSTERGDISVFGVNFDGVTGEELNRQIARMRIDFPVFSVDPGVKFGIPRPEVLPTTYIFAPNENRIVKMVGPQTAETILAAIK